ncbi:transcriptional regulator [Cryobacterium glaciale]|uniref:Transcriptional regulator n=1 Tax=Cryobacterium glaciale TaxID=1259145 RepID=A0A4R8UTJ1_9MICO|nr:transcriptional regulator [Cryobacterium glaciale]
MHARQPKAIHSALTVLEEVARCGAGITARQISDNLGLPRATAYRLLNVLVQDEYLVRTPDLSGFALGRKVVELANLVTPPTARPPEAVRAILDRLRGGIRGGIHLVRYEHDGLRVIDPDPDFPPSDRAVILARLDASAMGRLLVNERSRGAASAVLGQIHASGYASQVDEITAGYGCIAIPIRDRAGQLVAGLCLCAPRERIEHPDDLVAVLRRGAEELAPLLA